MSAKHIELINIKYIKKKYLRIIIYSAVDEHYYSLYNYLKLDMTNVH